MEEERIINAIRKMVANDADMDYYGISGAEIHDWLESKSSDEHSALQFAIAYLINNGYNRTAKCLEKYFNYAPDPSNAERKQLYSDGFDTARKALAGAFMQYIDEHRPEGKMCLSNGECAQLENSFKVGDVETIVRYISKYQQPAEWSEEDEKNWNEYIERLKSEYRNTPNVVLWDDINWLESLHERLKSLRPQPHWKPSNLELGALRTAISVLTEERNFQRAGKHLQDILDHFEGKETRHDWKPSEEQMKALNSVINCELSAELHTRAGILQTLQNDLKKL